MAQMHEKIEMIEDNLKREKDEVARLLDDVNFKEEQL